MEERPDCTVAEKRFKEKEKKERKSPHYLA